MVLEKQAKSFHRLAIPRVGFGTKPRHGLDIHVIIANPNPGYSLAMFYMCQTIPWYSLAVIYVYQTIPWVQLDYNLHKPKHTLGNFQHWVWFG